MRSTPPSPRRWDGSLIHVRARRYLRVNADGASRLLRCGQSDRCRDCGNRIEWYHHTNERPIHLHPHELPAENVPATCHWHVSSGVAQPAGDGSGWCRLPHAMLCPARDGLPSIPELTGLRRALAVNTRRLIDDGAFVPPSTKPNTEASSATICRPARPVVQLLYVQYLANRPVDEIQCVAQTRRRHRCTSPLLTPDTRAGVWTLVPTTATHGQLPLPGAVMAVYTLTGLSYAEQLRWRAQRCAEHAAIPTAADVAVAEWEPFDPLVHHEHIHTRLPTLTRRQGPADRNQKATQS
ncbi:DUF6083 domain-containing protein [Streptomyces sp. NBC_01210]|uniref:DUF6083 domain-containing protein n=1 Tax=Streptomyces sp. NBC_01210 TaxID=2903774 RepID=UPI002E130B25|nr:DUF6083 domain-containing protein [Streptomyces sp. NBC_01210]